MRLPRLNDIFSLHPTSERERSTSSSSNNNDIQWQKIRFDNTIRAWIAIPSYLACYVLAAQGVIASVIPMTLVFTGYAAIHLTMCWAFMNSRHGRKMDFVFASLDVIAMSLSVYFTGGTNSPLYFVYFIPLVIHAFHRDWGVVVYSGFGGVIFYAFAVSQSLTEFSPAIVTNIGARLFFMLLTVSIACLALAILKKQDAVDETRILRLKNLTLASEALNRMTTLSERGETAETIIGLVNDGLGEKIQAHTQFAFENAGSNFAPIEKYPSGSHAILPVDGAENESFGKIYVESPVARAFGSEEMQFLEFIAKSFGLSVQRLNRMEELRKSLEMNSWVMAANIASSRSAEETYAAVLDGVMTILNADIADLLICIPAQERFRTVLSRGGKITDDQALQFSLKNIKGEALGTIRAARRVSKEKISVIEVEAAATFAARAALSIENALVHERQREQIQLFVEDANRNKAA